jgi:peptide/nickel transport system substrate-binding protein
MLGCAATRRNVVKGSGLAALVAALPRAAWSAGDGILRVRTDLDPQSLDPGWMIGGLAETTMQHACLGTLAVYEAGETWGWQPSAFVEMIEQTDDLTIRFRLRPGIQWSGGFGELTSEDVRYTIERIADPAKGAPWQGKWASLDRVEVDGPYGGAVILEEPFQPIWLTTICHATASFVCKRAVEAKGGRFETEFPAVCGPYQVKQWLPKQRVELALNPLWNGPKPDFEEIHILTIEDEKAAELAYESGDVDLTAVSLDSLPRYRRAMPARSKLAMRPGTFWTWLGINTEHPKLADIRVRRAVQYAVDVDAILQAAYAGLAPRAHGIVPPGLIGHRTTSAIATRDLDKARSFLQAAGATGLQLELKTLNKSDRVSAAEIVQANLAEIGIEVAVTPVDEATFWNLGLESEGEDWKDLQLWIHRFGDAADPSQMTQWYVSEQVGVWNWERWKDPEFDALHKQGLAESDPKKRHDIYIRMQEIMENTGAYVWITHEPIPHLHRDSIEPALYPDGLMYLPWFERA